MKKYFLLAGIDKTEQDNSTFEMIYGSYNKEEVKEEKEEVSHQYKKMKIITLDNGNNAAIMQAMQALNN